MLYTKDQADTQTADLQSLRDEIAALRDQLRHTQRLAAIGTMASMVAHEFNNILTPVVNYAQLAQRRPELIDKALDKAVDGGRRASEICEAILGLARHVPLPHNEPFALAELVEATLTALARDPAKDSIEITVDIPASLQLPGGRVEVQQVLLNLILNARQALLDQGGSREIRIAARRRGADLQITVADNGPGIEPENLQRVFEPFFSTRTQRKGSEAGTGLGLAICHEIIQSMAGRMSVESEPGAGATFAIHLPCRLS